MKTYHSLIKVTMALQITFLIIFLGCGESNDPVSSEPQESSSVRLQVQVNPPTSLRTLDTWNYWTTPVNVIFEATTGEEPGGNDGGDDHGHDGIANLPVFTLNKLTNNQSGEDDEILVGTAEVAGMEIEVTVGDGLSLWEMHHDGELEEHHADEHARHVQIEVNDAATGHHAHGGVTIALCEVTLIAQSNTDTLEFELTPAQTGHGYRYEANAELPFGEYDIRMEIEPPHFFRTEETRSKWISDFEAEFTGFQFDSSFTSATIGESVLVGSSGDSLKITLRGGAVEPYGAIGIGAIPLSGNETINFSVRLEDPTLEAHAQPLYDAL
nr:hypothetical protein [candidate division Zixibacteria bacterium]NIS48256.1 hypothetical protein [candidate division Zixibacteria bacterium]NIU16373.1 hypothetical protein [candidate division Zixibacteria bacterium]NIV08492.1 hypothetical protein [candidate division Zixibacteria bacterium]NIW40950.1 hypothetical protein [candidate division Zixibacteria bacterium]